MELTINGLDVSTFMDNLNKQESQYWIYQPKLVSCDEQELYKLLVELCVPLSFKLIFDKILLLLDLIYLLKLFKVPLNCKLIILLCGLILDAIIEYVK